MHRWLVRGLRLRVVVPLRPVVRRVVAFVAVLLLFATLVVAAAPWSQPAVSANPVVEAPDEASAMIAARLQGSRVEVMGLRSESSSTFANPNGTWTLERSAGPVRVRRGDGWVPVDTTLVPVSDGSFAVKAATAEVVFSGGGRTPLVRMAAQGKELTLFWPGPLPDPRVEGDTATYSEVLPGVDLRLRATDRGFGHDIVVKSREAAASPALARITLGLETAGVR
ncbi:MAG: hypothetical protein GEV28_31250 [Actinophytocola sp.]|uniref:hypothetical protein n=1 Tax=Actinophytocola sp. TaxID=1872138 RepID=UPI001326DFF9|nr:hypothetical protein [Actinophytocola sp.]MPZ84622.1 hypothetical protein [Actinophytocola sp.]